MKIIKNAGKFTILSKSDNIIETITAAARVCYQSQDKASPENDIKLVRNIIERGHEAMIEFGDIIVRFDNVSRGFTHEMVRHRHCSFAQESSRYCDKKNFECVVPPHKDENEYMLSTVDQFPVKTASKWFDLIERFYRILRERGWKPEDARQILPTAISSQIVVKANLREWRHIFHMRCDYFAHWEIRVVMLELLKWCKSNIPIIFDDFYFFTTDSGIEYARKVPSKKQLDDMIKHFNIVNNTPHENMVVKCPVCVSRQK
jgi:thymidylate synthase (FAD)